MGLLTWDNEARIRRAVFLAKFINAPSNSWQHGALVWHVSNRSPWYEAASSDLQLIMPTIRL
eukprot:10117097-Karenia_brevis.AAC.1